MNDILSSVLIPHAGLGIKIVGALGLEDKVRPKARSALQHAIGPADDPRVTVRMVTGDSLHTAQAVALQVGLVTEQQVQDSVAGVNQSVIMSAQQFDEATRNGQDSTALRRILQDLRVLAKATPRHRVTIIEGI
jgi:magnesium-transporting ATPase (P-type)